MLPVIFFIPKVDYGIRREDTTGWYHPGCKVTWILLQIMKDNGVTFTFPANRAFMLSRLFVPLLTRNDSRSYAAKMHYMQSLVTMYMDVLIRENRKNCILQISRFQAIMGL